MNKKVVAEENVNEWLFSLIDKKSLIINRIFDSKNETLSTLDITSNLWYFATFKIKGESFYYERDKKKILFPKKSYGIFYPKYSISRIGLIKASVDIKIYASSLPCKSFFPNEPVIFDNSNELVEFNYDKICDYIKNVDDFVKVGISSTPSGIGQKIKEEIDKDYLTPKPLSDISKKLSISSSLMSIYFKRAYFVSPSEYRKNLRIISSIEKLLHLDSKNDTVPLIAFESGYNDLGRYYKQFKSVAGVTPGKMKA